MEPFPLRHSGNDPWLRRCRARRLDPLPLLTPTHLVRHRFLFLCPNPSPFLSATRTVNRGFTGAGLADFRLCEHETLPPLNLESLVIKECESDDELMAAVRLRVRTFYVEFEQSSGSNNLAGKRGRDFALHRLPAIASKFKIQCACFLIFPPPFMAFVWGDVEALAEDNGEWRKTAEEFTKPPKWIPFSPNNLAYRPHEAENFVWMTRDNASGISDLKSFVPIAKGCSLLAIRGCFEFDSIWITLNSELYKKPFIPVGLLPPSGVREEDKASDGESMILEWLSKQSPRSVVYVAFGSEDTLSPEHKRELALGLELSKIPFLWALRRPAGHPAAELLPEAFEERTKDYGLVAASWVPQIKILNHESIGAFYTHCGWGSIIEGLQFGHPFITMPLFADHAILARRVEAEKIRLEVPRNEEDGSFTREAVATAIRKVVVEEEGKAMRSNAQKLQKVLADKDLHESYIGNLIKQLKDFKE